MNYITADMPKIKVLHGIFTFIGSRNFSDEFRGC
jgi:hypothetical protein